MLREQKQNKCKNDECNSLTSNGRDFCSNACHFSHRAKMRADGSERITRKNQYFAGLSSRQIRREEILCAQMEAACDAWLKRRGIYVDPTKARFMFGNLKD